MLKKLALYIRSLPLLYSVGGGVIIVAIVLVGVHFLTRSAPAAEVAPQVAHVKIASVASLSSQSGPLPVTGTVTSLNQATILAQSSGEVVSLRHELGDTIAAGSIIAAMENSSQQAAVVQAEGAYEAAEAALAKASGSTAANSGLSSESAAQTAANAQTSALAALQSAYAALDDAVHTKADILFSNPRTQTPSLLLSIPDSQLAINVVNERSQLEGVLANANILGSGTNAVNIDKNIAAMTSNAQTVGNFLNDLIKALNQQQSNQSFSASTIAADQSLLSAARTEVVSAISSLASAKSSYDSAQSGAQTAANSAGSATTNDIAASAANVKSALGSLQAAKANLEKTIIRSPISGTIVSLAITQGDFVPSFSQVAQVSNPGALEVETYVTSDDAKTITVGSKAVIDTTAAGVIVSIAPAVDPTNGKILVKIGITSGQNQLTDGNTVTLTLTRSIVAAGGTTAKPASIVIPIIAAKITPSGPVVFTVSSSTLMAVPVTLGAILGEQVVVLGGITEESDIVTDARGLSDGQMVIVDTQ